MSKDINGAKLLRCKVGPNIDRLRLCAQFALLQLLTSNGGWNTIWLVDLRFWEHPEDKVSGVLSKLFEIARYLSSPEREAGGTHSCPLNACRSRGDCEIITYGDSDRLLQFSSSKKMTLWTWTSEVCDAHKSYAVLDPAASQRCLHLDETIVFEI